MDSPVSAHPTVISQYSAGKVSAIVLAATIPMGVGAWIVAPALMGMVGVDSGGGSADGGRFAQILIATFTAGLAWQFLLVVGLVAREQRTLRWRVVRDALWLNPPTDAAGRRGGRRWWWVVALIACFGAIEALPLSQSPPAGRDLGAFLGSSDGQDFLRGNWPMLALVVLMALLNTVLGEELLFRGLLLPRMGGAFGKADWVVNGIAFGLYHLHQPWSIPSGIATGLAAAFATRRLHSAWMGIIAHSVQSLIIVGLTVAIVLS